MLAWQREVVARERDRAARPRRRAALDAHAANQVTEFLIGLFEVASPIGAAGEPGDRAADARRRRGARGDELRRAAAAGPPADRDGRRHMGLRQDHTAERLLKDALAARRSWGRT